MAALPPIFESSVVAVVGASDSADNVGVRFVHALDAHRFDGTVVVVHPTAREVAGHRAVPSLAGNVEVNHVIVAVGTGRVADAVADAAEAGADTIHVFTGGFSETRTPAGMSAEGELVAMAHASGARLLGPNCMGVHRPSRGWTFRPDLPVVVGRLGMVSQSGGIAIAAIRRAAATGRGLSAALSMGNGADLTVADGIRWLAADPETEEISVYVESAGPGDLLGALAEAAARKPVRVWAAGIAPRSADAAAFHTGARGGPVDAGIFGPSIVRCNNLEALLGESASAQPTASNPTEAHGVDIGIGVISISGGVSVVVTEALERAGFRVPALADNTVQGLTELVAPLAGNTTNPVDLGGSYLSRGRLGPVVEAIAADPAVDHVVFHVAIDYVEEVEGRHPGYVAAWAKRVGDTLGAIQTRASALLWPIGVSVWEDEARRALAAADVTVVSSIDALVADLRDRWRVACT